MQKLSFLCLASLAALCSGTGYGQNIIDRPPVSQPGEWVSSPPQGDKAAPNKPPPDHRGGRPQDGSPVRGSEHVKAAKAAYELGVKYGRAGRYEEAAAAFEDALLYNPKHWDAQFGLGRALYDLGRWAAAADAFKRTTTLNRKDGEAFNYLGAAYFKQGLYDKAIEAYKEALILNPDWAEVRYNVANAFYRMGRYEPAIRYYLDTTYYKPKSVGLFNDLGVAYAEWGRHDQATEAFRRATRQDSDDAYAYNNLALSHYLQGRFEDAAKAFARASRLAPYDALIRSNGGVLTKSSEGGVVGERVSLPAAGGRRDQRWLGRSGIIHGIEESDELARKGVRSDVAPRPGAESGSESLRVETAPPASVPPPPRSATPDVITSAAGKSEAPPSLAPAAVAVAPTEIYRIGVGDVIDIRLLDGKGDNAYLYTVGAGGLIEYPPLGGPFPAAGKTAEEIADYIKSELKRRAISGDAAVVVGVREYASHTVIISGLVREPGAKVLRREAVPLYVIIADAQPLPEAGRVLITSDAGARNTEVALDDEAANGTLVRPGDVINVLGRPQRFYYIAGKVQDPGRKDFHPGITLTQAILAAGGALHSSKTALVTRQDKDGLLSASKYDLREIMAGGAPDPTLFPGDRIEVIR